METENSLITIVFEDITPEYLEFIDICKERAQGDNDYKVILLESMSTGRIEFVNQEDSEEEIDDEDENDLKTLLEYQIKLIENMNYSYDIILQRLSDMSKNYRHRDTRSTKGTSSVSHKTFIKRNEDPLQLNDIVNRPKQNIILEGAVSDSIPEETSDDSEEILSEVEEISGTISEENSGTGSEETIEIDVKSSNESQVPSLPYVEHKVNYPFLSN